MGQIFITSNRFSENNYVILIISLDDRDPSTNSVKLLKIFIISELVNST